MSYKADHESGAIEPLLAEQGSSSEQGGEVRSTVDYKGGAASKVESDRGRTGRQGTQWQGAVIAQVFKALGL